MPYQDVLKRIQQTALLCFCTMKTVFCRSSLQPRDGIRAVVKHSQIVLSFTAVERPPWLGILPLKLWAQFRRQVLVKGILKKKDCFRYALRQPFKHKTPNNSSKYLVNLNPSSVYMRGVRYSSHSWFLSWNKTSGAVEELRAPNLLDCFKGQNWKIKD